MLLYNFVSAVNKFPSFGLTLFPLAVTVDRRRAVAVSRGPVTGTLHARVVSVCRQYVRTYADGIITATGGRGGAIGGA